MKKSHKIIASLAAVGALCVGTAAIAGPWHHDGEVRGGMPCAGYASQDYQAAGWEAVARLVTITPEQQGAWKAYVDARTALDMMPGVQFDKPAVDEQSRLERRAQVAKVRADLLEKAVAARTELFKVLSPEQKYVLESFEQQHAGHGMHRGFRGPQGFQGFGPGCPGMDGVPGNPDCPMNGPRMHHRGMMGY